MDVKKFLSGISEDAKKHATQGIYEDILHNSRQSDKGPLSEWFDAQFRGTTTIMLRIMYGVEDIFFGTVVDGFLEYVEDTGITDFVVGISGGADSATTLALLHEAKKQNKNINIHPYIIPIEQKESETNLGIEICEHFGIEYKIADLTNIYKEFIKDENLGTSKIRQGNIKARIRMTYLYDQAHSFNGIVISTDNFSEYTAGFYTVHGDVGDFAPLQGLFKSSEIPLLAKELRVPEKFWRVTPTDGLGISNSDEEQLGMTYLEWDILSCIYLTVTVIHYHYLMQKLEETGRVDEKDDYADIYTMDHIVSTMSMELNGVYPSEEDRIKILKFVNRVHGSKFKRMCNSFIDSPVTRKVGLISFADELT